MFLHAIPVHKLTHDPEHSNVEGEPPIDATYLRRCGYPQPKPTRRAVNFKGEPRGKRQIHAANDVDIPATKPLETLCNRMVSARARSAEGRGVVDIQRRQPIATLCISMVRVTAERCRNPCQTGCERHPPPTRSRRRAATRFPANNPPAPTRRPSRPTAVRENSLKSRQKAAQFFSLRARPSKMRKNILGRARKNRAIRCRQSRVARRPAEQPRTAQSGDIPP